MSKDLLDLTERRSNRGNVQPCHCFSHLKPLKSITIHLEESSTAQRDCGRDGDENQIVNRCRVVAFGLSISF